MPEKGPKQALDGILEDFVRESRRLLRLHKNKGNFAVIGCGNTESVGYHIANILKQHLALKQQAKGEEQQADEDVGKLWISNRTTNSVKFNQVKSVLGPDVKDLPYGPEEMKEFLIKRGR